MPILWATILAAGSVVLLAWLPQTSLREELGRPARGLLAALLCFLPLLFGAVVLDGARERTRALRFDYVGKRLAFGTDRPLTVGSAGDASREAEDLVAPFLGHQSVVLEPPSVGGSGTAPPAGVLRLASPSPAVRVDGAYCNSYPLDDGDAIVARSGARGAAVRITYEGGKLAWSDGLQKLPSAASLAFAGGAGVLQLSDVHPDLAGVYSFLHRPRPFGPWHLLIRSREVEVERGGAPAAAFAEECPVPAAFELALEVVRDDGSLRTQRRDSILIRGEEVEVRFGAHWRWARAVPPRSPELTLALGVPSAFAREEMVEFPEPSPRFRGLAALYRYDRRSDRAMIAFLGDEEEVRFGDLYALGTGGDRMLVRLDRHDFPRQLLLDLALLSLFLAVFLGRGMAAHAGLAAVVAAAGLLLAQRLLFSHKAANHPPDFAVEAFDEARFALWLVPAFLLFAWALAWLLRQGGTPAASRGRSLLDRLRPLGWPLAGLSLAGLGAAIVSAEATAARRVLGLLPIILGALLALLHLLARGPRTAAALGRLRQQGLPWRVWWIVPAGALVLLVRGLADPLGMPETVRLPFSGFRLLWTVVQLPLCAILVGLTLERLRWRNGRAGEPADASAPPAAPATRSRLPAWAAGLAGRFLRLPSWLRGVAAVYAFVFLAFLVVAIVVGDTGLLLVHALAPVVALVAVAAALPVPGRRLGPRLAAALLASLPLVAAVAVVRFPGALVRVMGWGAAGAEAGVAPGAPVREQAAELSSTRAQQMFRLYMLASPAVLAEVGLEPAERVAIHYLTYKSYARLGGWSGTGYLATDLPRHMGVTYLSDLVPMVFVLTEFGRLGMVGLALLYLLAVAAVPLTARSQEETDRLAQQGLSVALVALLACSLPGLYMLLANLNLVLFTGKNTSLLALNSLSDVLESGALLALAVVGLGSRRGAA